MVKFQVPHWSHRVQSFQSSRRLLHCHLHDLGLVICRYFPSPEEYKGLLEQEGFNVESIELIPRPTLVSTGVVGWLETFATGIIQDLPESTHGQVSCIGIMLSLHGKLRYTRKSSHAVFHINVRQSNHYKRGSWGLLRAGSCFPCVTNRCILYIVKTANICAYVRY